MMKFENTVAESLRHCPEPHSFDARLAFLALALAGEAGEAANCAKKIWRDGYSGVRLEKLAEEVVDAANYISMIAMHLGWTDDELRRRQHEKLAEVQKRPEFADWGRTAATAPPLARTSLQPRPTEIPPDAGPVAAEQLAAVREEPMMGYCWHRDVFEIFKSFPDACGRLRCMHESGDDLLVDPQARGGLFFRLADYALPEGLQKAIAAMGMIEVVIAQYTGSGGTKGA